MIVVKHNYKWLWRCWDGISKYLLGSGFVLKAISKVGQPSAAGCIFSLIGRVTNTTVLSPSLINNAAASSAELNSPRSAHTISPEDITTTHLNIFRLKNERANFHRDARLGSHLTHEWCRVSWLILRLTNTHCRLSKQGMDMCAKKRTKSCFSIRVVPLSLGERQSARFLQYAHLKYTSSWYSVHLAAW